MKSMIMIWGRRGLFVNLRENEDIIFILKAVGHWLISHTIYLLPRRIYIYTRKVCVHCDGLWGGTKHEDERSLFLFRYSSCQREVLQR